MTKGDPHTLGFDDAADAKAALAEVEKAISAGPGTQPVTIAGRLLVRPVDVRSAEVTEFFIGV